LLFKFLTNLSFAIAELLVARFGLILQLVFERSLSTEGRFLLLFYLRGEFFLALVQAGIQLVHLLLRLLEYRLRLLQLVADVAQFLLAIREFLLERQDSVL
jgi:hypothetical protein